MGLRKRCDCLASATLNSGQASVLFEVCPECLFENNVFEFNVPGDSLTFTAETFNLPACLFLDAGSAFSIDGTGRGTLGSNNFEAVFTVSLLPKEVANEFTISITGFDQNGTPVTFFTSLNVEQITIINCNDQM